MTETVTRLGERMIPIFFSKSLFYMIGHGPHVRDNSDSTSALRNIVSS